MPSYVIKPNPDKDFYVLWSDNTESPWAWGPADEVHVYLVEDAQKPHGDKTNQWLRILRADEYGSSARWPSSLRPFGGYDDGGFIYKQQGWLPRWRLTELCARLELDHDVDDLLEPLED